MTVPLSQLDHRLLTSLAEDGGFATGTLCRYAGVEGQTAAARRSLLHMKKLGLVREMDDQKPVCWVRTAAGTERAGDPTHNEEAA